MPQFEVTTITRQFFKKIVEAETEAEAELKVLDECDITGDLGEAENDGSIDVEEVRKL